MKKLRLNNIFHWLYAFLLFMPFIFTFGFILTCVFNGNVSFVDEPFWYQVADNLYTFTPSNLFGDGSLSFVEDALNDVFVYLCGNDSDVGNFVLNIRSLFVYWAEISLVWLCFDVLMFVINLAHRWIDRGTDL